MRQSNLTARVAPFVLAGLRRTADEQGVSVDQLVNLALGQFVASHREAGLLARAEEAGQSPEATRTRALAALDRLGSDEVQPGDEPRDGGVMPSAARLAS